MSKAVSKVGKVVKKAAPVLIPVGIGIATGGFGFGAAAAGSGAAGAAGASSAALAASGPMGGAWAGGGLASSALGSSIFGSVASQAVPAAAPVATGEASGGLIGKAMGWIKENPEASKLIGGAVAGGADAYQRERELDEIKRQFDESRKFSGSFYGIPRGGLVSGRQRQQFL